MQTLVWRGGRAELKRRLARLPAVFAGRDPDGQDLARGLALRVAVAALSKIQQWFLIKARGGTDPTGLKWPPLSPRTLAYGRRFGPGEQAGLKKAAGLTGANRFAPGKNKGLLTASQLKRWRQVFAQTMAWLAVKEVPRKEAAARAAAHAWETLKAEGAQTKLAVYGNRPHEILRDTGVLFASLGPGIADRPSAAALAAGQVFDVKPGEAVVGTNVPYAKAHHEGDPARRLPRRKLWPDPADWPRAAWADVAGAGVRGLERLLVLFVMRGARS